jgi:hypothetical protein
VSPTLRKSINILKSVLDGLRLVGLRIIGQNTLKSPSAGVGRVKIEYNGVNAKECIRVLNKPMQIMCLSSYFEVRKGQLVYVIFESINLHTFNLRRVEVNENTLIVMDKNGVKFYKRKVKNV